MTLAKMQTKQICTRGGSAIASLIILKLAVLIGRLCRQLCLEKL